METPRSFRKFKKGPFLLALFLLLGVATLFAFTHSRISENKRAADAYSLRSQEEVQNQEETRALEKLIRNVENERLELESHFVSASNVVPFLNELEKIALSAGARAELSEVEVAGDSSGLLVQIKAEGSFEGVYKYLLLLENAPYELEIISVRLSAEGESWVGNFRVKLLSFLP